MTIYASNLCNETTEPNLRAAFATYGTVDSCVLSTDKATGKPNNCARVEMKNDTEARAAIKGLEGSSLGSKKIHVSETEPAAVPAASAARG